jgi:glycosyltransferase involved in cell wall biosynthesis
LIIKGDETNDSESKEYYFKIKEQIMLLHLEDAIVEKVNLTDEEMVQLYTIADCIVSVPSSDGMPLTVLEAMACGTGVISSDLPSLHEIISHKKNGVLVPVRDHEALSNAMIELHKDQAFRKKTSKANRDFVVQEADFFKEMEKLEVLYQSLLPD